MRTPKTEPATTCAGVWYPSRTRDHDTATGTTTAIKPIGKAVIATATPTKVAIAACAEIFQTLVTIPTIKTPANTAASAASTRHAAKRAATIPARTRANIMSAINGPLRSRSLTCRSVEPRRWTTSNATPGIPAARTAQIIPAQKAPSFKPIAMMKPAVRTIGEKASVRIRAIFSTELTLDESFIRELECGNIASEL